MWNELSLNRVAKILFARLLQALQMILEAVETIGLRIRKERKRILTSDEYIMLNKW
jgi:hypothetical protein